MTPSPDGSPSILRTSRSSESVWTTRVGSRDLDRTSCLRRREPLRVQHYTDPGSDTPTPPYWRSGARILNRPSGVRHPRTMEARALNTRARQPPTGHATKISQVQPNVTFH